MKAFVRGSAVLLATAAAMAALPQAGAQPGKPAAAVQDKKMLSTDRDKVSYAIGMDVGSSFKPIATDVDFAALEKAVRNAFDGGKPLISQEDAKVTDTALRARVAARDGTPTGKAPGAAPPAVDKAKVGLMLGSYMVGPSLTPIKDEIDLPLLMQGMHAGVGETAPLLPQDEARSVLERFGAQMKARMEAKASAAAETNRKEGAEFLSKNKATKGVIVLPSGLQYMVLREGAGARPKPSDRVRVNYHGTLLDGTVFDSSYDRGQPAEFALNQVIAGWTEGVALMPVGAKYRFWIPGDLAYGAKGTPGGPIGPNATLVFDVELMAIL